MASVPSVVGNRARSATFLQCAIADPTGSVGGTMFHGAATGFLGDDELGAKPCVALVQVAPDPRTPGKPQLEIFALKAMFTASGALNVFRTPPARFPCSGTRVVPTCPGDVIMSAMLQTSVYGNFCSHMRFLLKITNGQIHHRSAGSSRRLALPAPG